MVTAPFNVTVKNVPAAVPKMERHYTAKLSDDAVIDVTIFTWGLSWSPLYKSAKLTQPNGNMIYFDPDKIAEKIIDHDLVPLVQAAVGQIYELDAPYRENGGPTEFVDEKGAVWRKLA